ncbi:MAG: ubiquitin-conjugating enzyme E2 [Promethearchaeota archaeon]|nr:MAG: ubiquitin-conjugating enzyme E2 [Candidatus Lokiarchaeota archaeon]
MLSEEDFYARLAYEAKILEEEEPSFKPIDGDLTTWEGFILGTGLFEGGVFKIQINVTRKFPFEAPKVKWLSKIWHPNIYRRKVCVGVQGKDWTPTMSIAGLIEALRNLLNFPNPNSPLNSEAANQMKTNPKKYEQMVRKYVEKYAKWDDL